MQAGKLGQDQDIFLTNSLDTWDGEVRGSSARVFLGTYRYSNGNKRQAAFKFMRPPETEDLNNDDEREKFKNYCRNMFVEEAPILYQLREVSGVMRMFGLGFLKLGNALEIPSDLKPGIGRHLVGELLRLEPEETETYLKQFDAKLAEGWFPYLLLERFRRENNLLLLCDKHRNRGHYFPLQKGLRCAVQACEILQTAHKNKIVYRDHKIVHYYWDDERQHLAMIDWNVAKRHPGGLSQYDINHDLVQFASRALHYILLGRLAPGALDTNSRTEEVEQAPVFYQTEFSYQDRKHLKGTRGLLEDALSGKYHSAESLGKALTILLASL